VTGILAGNDMFTLLGCLLAGLGVAEFNRLTDPAKSRLCQMIDIVAALVLVIGVDNFTYSLGRGYSFPTLAIFGALYLVMLLVRLIAQLYSGDANALRSLSCSLAGQLYIALPVSLMGIIYNSAGGRALLLAMFIMIWLNDTGAYLVGSQFGRHRLFERISPKKSWEGFIGGVVFAVMSAFLFRYGFAEYYGMRSIGVLLGLGVTVSVFATWGDLVESLIKRTVGVKDSGNIMPGHGGILDRIDSLLSVAPATVAYLAMISVF